MTVMQPLVQDQTLVVEVLRYPDRIPDWDMVMSFLELRKQVFIDQMKWPLQDYHGIEFEQYDALSAVYLVAHRGRRVVGGARLVRSDQRMGSGRLRYSYMIRDAFLGLLPGLPREIAHHEPPSDPHVWELTRLATLPGEQVGPEILTAANAFLKTVSARTCLFLGPPAFMRMARKMGFDPVPMGPITGNQDGRFLAFACDVI